MTILLTTIHIIACIFLIIVVLLQQGKGSDVNAVFGGSSQTIFGSSGAGNFLTKLTSATAIIFMFTSLSLTIGTSKQGTKSVFDDVPSETSPATPEQPPATPQGENASPTAPAPTPESPTGASPADPASGVTVTTTPVPTSPTAAAPAAPTPPAVPSATPTAPSTATAPANPSSSTTSEKK